MAQFNFTHDASVEEFAVSKETYLAAHPGSTFDHIATHALVLDTNSGSAPRVLLLQRAASDSNPNKWEPPGGAIDDEDPSVLHGAARELLEEAGLEASHVLGTVGEPHRFTTRSGKKVCQFRFAVQIKTDGGALPTVKLDPMEHQDFVWATEDEVKARISGDVRLDFTSMGVERVVLKAFERFREK